VWTPLQDYKDHEEFTEEHNKLEIHRKKMTKNLKELFQISSANYRGHKYTI
jgi:hypothetical protein